LRSRLPIERLVEAIFGTLFGLHERQSSGFLIGRFLWLLSLLLRGAKFGEFLADAVGFGASFLSLASDSCKIILPSRL
jgi:hypothetical protein